jgi:hypothetical protein
MDEESPDVSARKNLFAALAKAQGQMPDFKKNQTANAGQYSYSYIDLAEVIKKTAPVLAKHGLSIVQLINGETLETIIGHESGEMLKSVYPLPNASTTKPQAMGSAITYARRYSLCAILNISADEDDDAGAIQNVSNQSQSNSDQYVMQKGKFAGMTPSQIPQSELESWLKYMNEKGWTKGPDFKAAVQYLQKAKGG